MGRCRPMWLQLYLNKLGEVLRSLDRDAQLKDNPIYMNIKLLGHTVTIRTTRNRKDPVALVHGVPLPYFCKRSADIFSGSFLKSDKISSEGYRNFIECFMADDPVTSFRNFFPEEEEEIIRLYLSHLAGCLTAEIIRWVDKSNFQMSLILLLVE